MIYIKFQDLSLEEQNVLLASSREDVDHKFGDSIRKHCKETGADYKRLIDEETIKNLYSYDYVFNI